MGGLFMYRRMTLVGAVLVLSFTLLVANIAVEMQNTDYTDASLRQSQTVLTAGQAEGMIYDRRFTPLVNQRDVYYASVIPSREAIEILLPIAEEMSPIMEGIRTGKPFICRVSTDQVDCDDIIMLTVPERRNGKLLAQHVIGYTQEHSGITGLEADYERILRGTKDTATVTYTVDAQGKVLLGEIPVVSPVRHANPGVVTTLDTDIQKLCEEQPIAKGAVVVMDVESGDILGMASYPSYDPDKLEEAMAQEDSPLINRCLCAYSVGSIFKLMTCAAAYQEGTTDFITECTGKTEVKGQVFRCHDWRGHGVLDMKRAMTYSCNVYFVNLSTLLDPAAMRETAQRFGFGTQIVLTSSLVSASGTLPTMEDLQLPAEMANFCFGQGLLTASPLQVAQMTCGIANDGDMPLARLIRGYTEDGETVGNEKETMYAHALPRNAAYYLQDMMIAAINESDNSNAVPSNVYAAAKTSTAQTGRYNEEEIELCHAWITGYFPIEDPKYAVTVLVEDGGYGNDAAAPIFRTIAEQITASATNSLSY